MKSIRLNSTAASRPRLGAPVVRPGCGRSVPFVDPSRHQVPAAIEPEGRMGPPAFLMPSRPEGSTAEDSRAAKGRP